MAGSRAFKTHEALIELLLSSLLRPSPAGCLHDCPARVGDWLCQQCAFDWELQDESSDFGSDFDTEVDTDYSSSEGYEESGKEMERFQESSTACSDGAGGFRKSKRLGPLPPEAPVVTMSHSVKPGGSKRFAKSAKLPKEEAPEKLRDLFANQGRNQPASSSFRWTAGAQAMKGCWGNSKNQFRKGNNLGRGAVDQATEHGLGAVVLARVSWNCCLGVSHDRVFQGVPEH